MNRAPDWYLKAIAPDGRHMAGVISVLSSREASRRSLQHPSAARATSLAVIERKNGRTLCSKRGLPLPMVPWASRSAEPPSLSPEEEYYSIGEAYSPTTASKNRYTDIAPYDACRVKVNEQRERYLNGSWVRELEGGDWWLATQAPLPQTTHAFLSLFTSLQPSHSRLRTIVQLTPPAEKGVRKADLYFPSSPNHPPLVFQPEPENSILELPSIQVRLVSQEGVAEAACVVSVLRLSLISNSAPATADGRGPTFDVRHIQYNAWPDFGVPEDPRQLLALAKVASSINTTLRPRAVGPQQSSFAAAEPPPPILCHCSAGVGRTGAFIAISSLLRSAGVLPPPPRYNTLPPFMSTYRGPATSPLGPLPRGIQDDKVAREVDALREQRTTMVQKPEQVELIYDVLREVYQTS